MLILRSFWGKKVEWQTQQIENGKRKRGNRKDVSYQNDCICWRLNRFRFIYIEHVIAAFQGPDNKFIGSNYLFVVDGQF